LQARRPLAHRPGRQPPAVAKAAHAVNNDNFSVPRQLIVLQPVVGHDNLQIVRAEQRFHRVAAQRSDRDRRAGTLMDQHRFITRLRRTGPVVNTSG
jgi:hypothetical protein